MSNLPQSDWILAGRFVDGDLPSAEAARAESRIATDVPFAAAVDEIRQQSNLFRELPTFKPAEDLQQRTLQGSLDQVRAIMGVWPPEEETSATATTVTKASSDSFDWKSAAALVAALAGVVLIGSMLWPGGQPAGSNVAMGTAAPVANEKQDPSEFKGAELDDDEINHSKAAIDSPLGKAEFADALPSPFPSKSAGDGFAPGLAKKGVQMRSAAGGEMMKQSAQKSGTAQFGPMSGTPMKVKAAAAPENEPELAFITSAPVDQIWCVNQDCNLSRETVSQILDLNGIKVQREKPPNSVYANTEPAEAFYVAATRQQMILAMSQISNNADIEMIQLPNSVNSPIADAIAQQFAGAGNQPQSDVAEQSQKDQAPRFRKPETQALAQQLVSNSIPRNFVPLGPTPPILNPASVIGDLQEEADEESQIAGALTLNSSPSGLARSRTNSFESSKEAPSAKYDDKFHGKAGARKLSGNKAIPQVQSVPTEQVADEPEEAAEESLHQYLILVRGGEESIDIERNPSNDNSTSR